MGRPLEVTGKMSFILYSSRRHCDDYLIITSSWVFCVYLVSDWFCFLFHSSWLALNWLFPSEAPSIVNCKIFSLFFFKLLQSHTFFSLFPPFLLELLSRWSCSIDFLVFHAFKSFLTFSLEYFWFMTRNIS